MQMTIDEVMKPGTQSERILSKLEEAGPNGVTNRELNSICFRYSARLNDLRKQGHNIRSIQIKKGMWRFILIKVEA